MNQPAINTLKRLRHYYARAFGVKPLAKPESEQDPNRAAQYIFDTLTADGACMIARFGQTEITCLCNHVAIKRKQTNYFGYIKGISPPWWWEPGVMQPMQQNAGFFPARRDKIEQFCELLLGDAPEVDILGSWLPEEVLFDQELHHAKKVRFCWLDPYWSDTPWTRALAGKTVLVVHPFTDTIERQYEKRRLLFEKNDMLPDFKLKTIKAVQSITGMATPFADWFAALDFMKSEIDRVDYDVCLIGCGAYGFPLAAHVKRAGKKAFHMGGSLQLLFGITGSRWADKNYNKFLDYSQLMNQHWVRPSREETPPDAVKVEGACYW